MKRSLLILPLLALLLFIVACTDPNDQCAALENPARDECYYNSTQCDEIETTSLKESCLVEQVKLTNDAKLCDQIDNEQTKAYCQVQIILKNNQTRDCRNISDPYWKNNCHYQMAQQAALSTECGLINFGEQRSRCYQEVAYATNDISLCLWTVDLHYQCVTKIAVQTQNEATCNKIYNSDEFYRARCFLQVAKAANDVEICAKASYPKFREECRAYFNATVESNQTAE